LTSEFLIPLIIISRLLSSVVNLGLQNFRNHLAKETTHDTVLWH